MNKVRSSNRINRLLGGDELLFCTRVYVQSKLWGGFWIVLYVTINIVFKVLRKETDHIRSSYLWERRQNGKAQNKARKVCATSQKRETSGNKASKNEG